VPQPDGTLREEAGRGGKNDPQALPIIALTLTSASVFVAFSALSATMSSAASRHHSPVEACQRLHIGQPVRRSPQWSISIRLLPQRSHLSLLMLMFSLLIFGYGAKPLDQRFFFKGDIMMKSALLPLTVGLILGSAVCGVEAAPLSGLSPATSQNQSPIEKIGCSRGSSNDTCPYGYSPSGHGCKPCGWNEHGSRHRDWNEGYYEQRRYRDYDHGYRDYDHGYYGPRRYPPPY
jgi:hypothetical protein